MKILRQVFSVGLAAAFICFNTQSADFHVHAAPHADAEHRHGPAAHHHDIGVRWPDRQDAQLTAVDADDTVILVRLSAASAFGAKPATAQSVESASIVRPTVTIVGGPRVVARAHGPPAFRANSLRAPPASQPL